MSQQSNSSDDHVVDSALLKIVCKTRQSFVNRTFTHKVAQAFSVYLRHCPFSLQICWVGSHQNNLTYCLQLVSVIPRRSDEARSVNPGIGLAPQGNPSRKM